MKYIVYQTVNKINGMLYVGVHKTKNPNKFDKYIGGGIYIGDGLKYPKTAYQHALKKYGYYNFVRTTLFVYDTAEEAFNKESEIVNIAWVKNRNNYNTMVGGKSGACFKKPLYQFDYKGNLIKKWDAIFEAVEYYGCCSSRFWLAIKNKYSAFESYWSDKESINISEYRKAFHSEVYQFDLKGNYMKTWKSIAEITKTLNYNKKSISEAICGKKLYKNCWWSHNKDDINEIIKLNLVFNRRTKSVDVLDSHKNFVLSFMSIKLASQSLNIKYEKIKHAINKEKLVDGLFYFTTKQIKKITKVQQFDLKGNLIKIWDSATQCAKEFPKSREVLKGVRQQTKGYTFEYILE